MFAKSLTLAAAAALTVATFASVIAGVLMLGAAFTVTAEIPL